MSHCPAFFGFYPMCPYLAVISAVQVTSSYPSAGTGTSLSNAIFIVCPLSSLNTVGFLKLSRLTGTEQIAVVVSLSRVVS